MKVTPAFYRQAERLWGPLAAEWRATRAKRFTTEELERITDFLRATNQAGRAVTSRTATRGGDRVT